MSNLPKGWVKCVLGDVLYLQNGYAFNSKDYADIGIDIIRISDIQDNKVTTEKSVKYNKKNIDKCFYVIKGDLLLAMSGATTGKTGVYLSDEISYLNQRVGNLKIYSEEVLLPKYRNYFITNKRKEIERKAYGGAQPNISKQLIESLVLFLPPFNEQKRIVAKIEDEFEKIDKGIEKLKLAKEQIKQYKQSVLKKYLNLKSGQVVTLNDVTTKINDGTHKTPLYLDDGIPFISVKDIKNKQICFDDCKYISSQEHSILYKRCNPEIGDVLITKSGTIGRTAIINTSKIFDLFVSVALIKPNKDMITSKFLMYSLDNYIANIDINSQIKGGVIKNLHIEDIKKIEIKLLSISEQQKIVEEIEKRFAVADNVIEIVEENLKKAEQLKQSILKKAFEGKLVPQDPNDDPASILLEKIKSEREKNERI